MLAVAARRFAAIAAVGLSAVLTASAAAASPAPGSSAVKQLATVQLPAFKVVINALRGPSSGGVPSATVRVIGYIKKGSGWQVVKRERVGAPNSWFWFSVSVCSIWAAPAGPQASRDTVKLSLLVSPSVGCLAVRTLRL